MAELLQQRAFQARDTGEWQEAVTAWEALLKLEPHNAQAKEYLPVAQQNQKYTWIYQTARQFVQNGDLSTARQLLEEVWQRQNAPYYGDPAGLAKKIRMPVPPDFEEVRDAQRKTELTTEKRKTRHQAMKDFSEQVHISVPRIQTFFFCLVSGVGAITGVLTQSWIWALVCALVAAALVTALGYRKAMNWPLIITLALIGVAIMLGLTWYASSLPFPIPNHS